MSSPAEESKLPPPTTGVIDLGFAVARVEKQHFFNGPYGKSGTRCSTTLTLMSPGDYRGDPAIPASSTSATIEDDARKALVEALA